MANPVVNMIKNHNIKFVDLRFTDTLGKEHHVSIPAHIASKDFFRDGKMIDGSSIAGWKQIHNSDMILLPDTSTGVLDPFCDEPTLNVRCDVIEPATMQPYDRCPRALARRAEAYLRSTGIADTCYFGPEPEFFIFDDVRWETSMKGAYYALDSDEAAWNSSKYCDEGNLGHRPAVKGGYFPVPPVDSSQDIRSAMALTLEEMGIIVEAHHHEVATANQNEIATRYKSLAEKADDMQIIKYVIRNVAHAFGKTATFMPKPMVGDNGSGMHCHQSLAKNGKNVFAGSGYAGLSEVALYYIGGIIKHARALNAFTNPTTNSYRRLVPGFEAPILLVHSSCNRSAAIRIPYSSNAKARRIEVRFPDGMANPYLAFSAMMMAGLDGIRNKINPPEPIDKDLYELPAQGVQSVATVCHSLEQALDALHVDHAFLLAGNVFTEDFLGSYTRLKMHEITRLRMSTHPVEFEMYYSG